jgi:hypothetical protein
MGLSACSTTGMVVINRTATADFAIYGSEKYSEQRLSGSLQAVRVKGGLDTNGVLTYHDYEFDFSADALEQLAQTDPRVYVMHLASRSYLMQQPGMVMHQCEVRPCNIAKPLAQVLTTTEGLAAAKAKDERKNIVVTNRKMTNLATIGKELGKTVNIDGVDLVAASPQVRNVYCEFCKRTLTRACRLDSCRKKALGIQSLTGRKLKTEKILKMNISLMRTIVIWERMWMATLRSTRQLWLKTQRTRGLMILRERLLLGKSSIPCC